MALFFVNNSLTANNDSSIILNKKGEVKKMYRAMKIRLLPTAEQEVLFRKSAGAARWAYNYFLSENQRVYKETGKSALEGTIRKYINNVLKKTTHRWLGEVSSNVMKQAVKDANGALLRFFKGLSNYPKYKSRHKNGFSFYVNYETLKRISGGFQGEKLGKVKTAYPLPKIKGKYSNPRISYDGRNWFLSVGYEVKPEKVELTGASIGIDLGVKELAVVSTGKVYGNINKTPRVRQLKKRLKRQQRRLSRKLEDNMLKRDIWHRPVWKRPLEECQNIRRQSRLIHSTYKKLTGIRDNYLHQTTCEIVKTKPSRIVMEDLNVRGMMKNRHLSRAISEQKLHEFKRQIKYKCERYEIEFVEANRFYPSSKTCSCCGSVNHNLKLSYRIFKCPACGLKIDRDLNAAKNLANYKI